VPVRSATRAGALLPLAYGVPQLLPAAVLSLAPLAWTRQGLLAALVLLGVGLAISAAWALLLHERLQEQTGMMLSRLQRIAALEESYRELFENANDMGFTCELNGRITSLNCTGERITGFSRREALGMKIGELIAPEFAARAEQMLQEGAKPNGGETVELEILTRQGRRVPLEIRMRPILAEGKAVGLQGIARDVTERQRADEALRKSESRFRRLAESNMIGVTIGDATGRFLHANDAYLSLVGYMRQDLEAGRLRWDAITPPDRKPVLEIIRSKLQTSGVVEPIETVHLHKDGRRVPVLIGLARLEGKEDQAIGFVIDLTERQRAEQELEEAKHAAEVANRAKSEFLANMSHEIRTPMNGIIGMTELTLDTELDAEQREYLSMVKESADSLLTLINDILDFSKIEAGKLALDVTDFNLSDNLGHTVRNLAPHAHQKGPEIALEIAPGVPTALRGDPTRLRQIVVNLVSNAIKFTHQGEVLLRVEAESVREKEAALRFEVRDTGIGIPADKQAMIFDVFAQADGSMTRKYGGTGLGLAISRQLVELMGGQLGVESEVGRGSTFHFTARLERQSASERAEPLRIVEMMDLRGLRVLVVDDNATNRRILAAMLKHWRMDPALAEGGVAGLALLNENKKSGPPYPLVLIDAQMPDMDGFTLAERIKHDPELATATIMMLTSAGQRGDAARCRELGIGAYLIKPIRQSELLDAILMTLGKHLPGKGPALVTRHALREARRRLRILVVEDNPVNQQLAARLLEKQGHDVALAANGREALKVLEQTPQSFDVVVMDVQMPELDGLEATAKIREKEKATGGHLPIVAMTARAMKGDRERCLAAGMDGYVAKPIQPEAFLAEVELTAAGVATAGVAPCPEVLMAGERATLLGRVNGDAQLLSELVEVFVRNSAKLLGEIRDAAARDDARSLEFAAHQLRGSAANFDAWGVCAAAEKLEALGCQGSCTGAGLAVRQLEEELARLIPNLEKLRNEGKS
jgi:two-component system, sensor histidine kinase and response regulator